MIHEIVEKELLYLLTAQKDLTEVEVNEVMHFIEHGEYGLALTTFKDIIVEEKKHLSQESYKRCLDIATLMQLPLRDYDLLSHC